MDKATNRWWQRPFLLVMVGCAQFVLLTFLAMLFYPGGTLMDPTTRGYLFFRNFFSDLGLWQARNGDANLVAAPLFTVALAGAGLGLVLFFWRAPRLFGHNRLARTLSYIGSFFGVLCGLSYVGVALTPADRLGDAHLLFVHAAFITFLVVVVFYTVAILLHAPYANRYAAVYLLFALFLAAYLWLLFAGPRLDSDAGLAIQATGQKIIVYAAIVTIFVQAHGARQVGEGPGKSGEG